MRPLLSCYLAVLTFAAQVVPAYGAQDSKVEKWREASIVYSSLEGKYPFMKKQALIRPGIQELGLRVADVAACLEMGIFPSEPGPRKISVSDDATIRVTVGGDPWVLKFKAYDQFMLLDGLILKGISLEKYEERQFFMRNLVAACEISIARCKEGALTFCQTASATPNERSSASAHSAVGSASAPAAATEKTQPSLAVAWV